MNLSGGAPELRPNTVASASRCGSGESFQLSEHGGADLMEAVVCELQLRLDTDCPRNVPSVELS